MAISSVMSEIEYVHSVSILTSKSFYPSPLVLCWNWETDAIYIVPFVRENTNMGNKWT